SLAQIVVGSNLAESHLADPRVGATSLEQNQFDDLGPFGWVLAERFVARWHVEMLARGVEQGLAGHLTTEAEGEDLAVGGGLLVRLEFGPQVKHLRPPAPTGTDTCHDHRQQGGKTNGALHQHPSARKISSTSREPSR